MSLSTPENIRMLQRKLYCKAKQEPTCRFHSLYDKVYRADILRHAYQLVRANKGSAGIDGVTFTAIEEGKGVTAFLVELEEALRKQGFLVVLCGFDLYGDQTHTKRKKIKA